MKIKVTKKHIDHAKRRNTAACMVHEAIVDLYPDVTLPAFNVYPTAIVSEHNGHNEIQLPPAVADKIMAWDMDQYNKPFEFEVSDEELKELLGK